MKRLLLAALVAVTVITTTVVTGVDGRPATDRHHPSATAIRILPRTLPAPKVPVVFGKNRGPSPPPQQQQRQPYQQQQQQPYQQQQQQPKQQQRPKQRPQQLPKQQQQLPKQQQQQQATIPEKPKLETTTQDRSIITAPLKMCPEGQRMYPDRKCGPNYVDPEDEKK